MCNWIKKIIIRFWGKNKNLSIINTRIRKKVDWLRRSKKWQPEYDKENKKTIEEKNVKNIGSIKKEKMEKLNK